MPIDEMQLIFEEDELNQRIDEEVQKQVNWLFEKFNSEINSRIEHIVKKKLAEALSSPIQQR